MPRVQKDEELHLEAYGRPLPHKSTSWLGEIYASNAPLLPDELWRISPDFPRYDVSSKGRVRRADNHKLLSPSPRGKGQVNRAYLRVDLRRDTEDGEIQRFTVAIHSLVARTFHGEPASPDLEVAHVDGNNQNNRADNLRWVTHAENMLHQKAHGTAKHSMHCNLTRLCPNAVFMIRHLYQHEGWKFADIARLADLPAQVVARIAKRQSRVQDKPRVDYVPRA